ncbi:sugar ABC transporter ATP-binding protein [Modestobacter sp. NPDC049651]|uniref:sugar ABC transporter ATP-binding protein n=1 Tax=unclassified Modestobacter TaxID=2643866 RepID=UPI0033C4ED0D
MPSAPAHRTSGHSPAPVATGTEPTLSLRSVSKRFGPALVLDDVSLELHPGEIHGLVGQNGSGKSTLIKLLSGLHRADAGTVVSRGGEHPLPLSVAQLDALGVAFVHQDLGLVESQTVLDNVRVGRYQRGRFSRAVRRGPEADAVRASLARLRSDIDPLALVASLPPADRALVAIARALQNAGADDDGAGSGVLVFDESTQSLPREVLTGFYATVRELAAAGTAILLVSHQLDEVIALTDRVTVLKDGRVAGAGIPTAQTSRREITRLMLGADADTQALHDAVPTSPGEDGLVLRGVTSPTLHGLDLTVRAGEVVGITGTTGAGHDELPYVLAGVSPGRGAVRVGGTEVQLAGADPRALLDAGVALVPQARAHQGLALVMTAQDNLSLPRLRDRSGRWRVTNGWQRDEFAWVVEHLGVTPPRGDLPVAAFSGGNQQKLLLGKWLVAGPRALVLHEPTQAVDVGARRDILRSVRAAAAAGAAVLVSSIDNEDLATVCDRVLVLEGGVVVGELTGPLTADQVLDAVFRTELTTEGQPA